MNVKRLEHLFVYTAVTLGMACHPVPRGWGRDYSQEKGCFFHAAFADQPWHFHFHQNGVLALDMLDPSEKIGDEHSLGHS